MRNAHLQLDVDLCSYKVMVCRPFYAIFTEKDETLIGIAGLVDAEHVSYERVRSLVSQFQIFQRSQKETASLVCRTQAALLLESPFRRA